MQWVWISIPDPDHTLTLTLTLTLTQGQGHVQSHVVRRKERRVAIHTRVPHHLGPLHFALVPVRTPHVHIVQAERLIIITYILSSPSSSSSSSSSFFLFFLFSFPHLPGAGTHQPGRECVPGIGSMLGDEARAVPFSRE